MAQQISSDTDGQVQINGFGQVGQLGGSGATENQPMRSSVTIPQNPAGWHADPTLRHEYRFFDGYAWTVHISDNGCAGVDPLSQVARVATTFQAGPSPLGSGVSQKQSWQLPSQQGNSQAIASLVLGISSIIFCWWGLLTLAQVVLAIVFGSIGLKKAKMGAMGKNFSTAGLVLGIVGGAIYFMIGLMSFGAGWFI